MADPARVSSVPDDSGEEEGVEAPSSVPPPVTVSPDVPPWIGVETPPQVTDSAVTVPLAEPSATRVTVTVGPVGKEVEKAQRISNSSDADRIQIVRTAQITP